MLGDLFEQNNDFYKGKHYGGRRQFLEDSSPSKQGAMTTTTPHNPFLPPEEVRTRRQARRIAKHLNFNAADANADGLSKAGLRFQKDFLTFSFATLQRKRREETEDEEEEMDMARVELPKVDAAAIMEKSKRQVENAQRFIKIAKKAPLVIQHFQSTEPGDWEETYKAGCHVWIHKNSREVSKVCPWSEVHTDPKPKKRMSMLLRKSFDNDALSRGLNVVSNERGNEGGGIATNNQSEFNASQDSTDEYAVSNRQMSVKSLSGISKQGSKGSSNQFGYRQQSMQGLSEETVSNKGTTTFPLLKPPMKDNNSSRPNTGVVKSLGEGTGSLAYDSTELDDLFSMLDEAKNKKKKAGSRSKNK